MVGVPVSNNDNGVSVLPSVFQMLANCAETDVRTVKGFHRLIVPSVMFFESEWKYKLGVKCKM